MSDATPRCEKTAVEQIKFRMDFRHELARTETITTIVSTSISPAGPSIVSTSFTDKDVFLFITGGTVGEEYEVRVQVLTSSDGNRPEGVGILEVVPR